MVKAMKKYHIIVLIITTVVLSVIVPVIINECYKPNVGYITLWGAQDVLAYFGEILGALGSIFIGVIALYFYPITKAYNEEMQAELTERRKQTDY